LGHAFYTLDHIIPVFMSHENPTKALKVLWEELFGEDVSHLHGRFAVDEEN